MSLGALLRGARERRHLTIDDVARTTKIAPPFLIALERDDFTALPPGIFTRGFLRAYAREVGLEPEDVVDRYRTLYEPQDAETDALPARVIDLDEREPHWGRLAAALLGLAVVVYFLTFRTGEAPEPISPAPEAVAAPAPVVPAAPRLPAIQQAVREVPAAVGTSGGPLSVEIHATGPCWIEARADGARVLYDLLDAGDRRRIAAEGELVLLIGDPAAFELTIDNRPTRRLGRAGEPMTLRVTPDTVRDLLIP